MRTRVKICGIRRSEDARAAAAACAKKKAVCPWVTLLPSRVGFGFGITESTGDTTLSRVPGTFLSVLSVLKIGDF